MRITQTPVEHMCAAIRGEARKAEAKSASLGEARATIPRRFHSEEGAALVEFALIVPIFFIIVLGMAGFAFLFAQYLQLTEATNVGGQQLSIARGTSTDPCATVYNAVKGVSPYLTSANLKFTYTLNTTSYGPYVGSASTCTTGVSNLIQGDPVTVKIQYPCTLLWGNLGFPSLYRFNPLPTCNLAAQITEISQ